MRRRSIILAVMVLCAVTVFAAPEQAGPLKQILNSQSFWRVRIWNSGWVTLLKNGELERQPGEIPAPEDWADPEFSDEAWVRAPGPFFLSHLNGGWVGWGKDESISTALIRMRGRFSVTDPAAVAPLELTVRYRGGVVAWLNGKEIGRGDMPAGPVKANTLAQPYPDEAFVVPDGSRAISGGYGDPEQYKDRIAKRYRAAKLTIDPQHLRKGVNVLALEFHRTPYNEIATKKGKDGKRSLKNGRGVRPHDDHWSTVAMLAAELRARGDGIRTNVTRPAGFQVWNADPLLLIYDTDYGDAGVDPLPVRIVGTRNGRHSGVLVSGCDKPINGLKAVMSDFTSATGGKIPASAVEIRYQLLGEVDGSAGPRLPGGHDSRVTHVRRLDALAPDAPQVVAVQTKELRGKQNVVFGAVCPAWLTVHVPQDAAAGTYRGVCTIAADGHAAVQAPVVLEVCDWTLPPPHAFRTAAGFHQSPESVALHYKVPFWSDEHFKLLGESYRWLGSIGCDTLFAHLVERTNLGNAESIVRWKRKDGKPADEAQPTEGAKATKQALPKVTLETHAPDFTALDRYLDVALTHLVDPPVIGLYAWDNYCGTWYHGGEGSSHNAPANPARVTELLPDGTVRSAQGPLYNDVAAATAFWKPVAEHVRDYLKQRGLEKSIMIGIAHDSYPSKYVVDTWKNLLPEAPWCFEGHPRPGQLYGVPIRWCCTVWGAKWEPPRGLSHAWQIENLECHFDRDNWRHDAQSQLLSQGHCVAEKNISGGQRGFGRMSADLWPVVKDSRGRLHSISHRYPESGWGACDLRQNPFLKPGPNGALSTGRLEMIRDGLQESEARIFIEKALLDPANVTKLGTEFVAQCRQLLNLRRSFVHGSLGLRGAIVFLGSGRQDRVKELYRLAGEVAQKLGIAPPTHESS